MCLATKIIIFQNERAYKNGQFKESLKTLLNRMSKLEFDIFEFKKKEGSQRVKENKNTNVVIRCNTYIIIFFLMFSL